MEAEDKVDQHHYCSSVKGSKMTEEPSKECQPACLFSSPYNAVFCVMKFHAEQRTSDPIPFREAADNSESSEVDAQLFSAAERGDVKQVERALEQGANVNYEHVAGTPLTRAARRGHLECVEVLLDKGADVNLRGRFNCQSCTALHAAASNGHYPIAKLLLDHGANVNATRNQGSTPLHDAAKFGHPEIAQLLLQQGAEKNVTTSRGKTALFLAVSEGMLDGLRWVLEAVIEYYHYRGYCYSPSYFPEHAVEYLLNCQDKVNALGMSGLEALRMALLNDDMDALKCIIQERPAGDRKQRHLELVKLLLEAGVDTEILHEYETGALEEAILNKDDATIRLLIQYGADINRLGSTYGYKATPLHAACDRGTGLIVEILLENGADPNAYDVREQTPLHIAVLEKRPEYVKTLLRHGASVNVVDEDGKTPLHMVKTLDCAKLLVERGADVKAITKKGESVLFSAADSTGEGSCISYLIEQGADPLVRNEEGKSAIDLAMSRYECRFSYDKREDDDGGAECARVLLENGVEVDVSGMDIPVAFRRRQLGRIVVFLHSGVPVDMVTDTGKSLLFLAVEVNFASALRLLLERGADPNEKFNNISLLHTALMKGFEEPARVLLDAGAIVDNDFSNLSSRALTTYKNVLNEMKDVNRQDKNGVSLIHVLCQRGQPSKLLDKLLMAGTYVDIADNQGITPLHLVSFSGCKDFMQRLLDKNADVNRQDRNGLTPLHYAALKGHVKAAELLLDHGANPNAQDNEENTVAHIVVDHLTDDVGVEFLRTLLSHGAVLNTKDLHGCLPIHRAMKNGLVECAKMLGEEYGDDADYKPEECIRSNFPDLGFYRHISQQPECVEDDASDDDMGFGLFD